jgi:hypothetical protein
MFFAVFIASTNRERVTQPPRRWREKALLNFYDAGHVRGKMQRLTVFLKRRPELSREVFVAGWTKLFETVAAREVRPRKLWMNLPLMPMQEALDKLFGDHFDGVGELLFDTTDHAVDVLTCLNADAELRALARECIDIDASTQWLAEIVPQYEVPGTGIKFVVAGQTADGWSVPDAQRYWREVHFEVAKTVPDFMEYLTQYVQMHGRDLEALGGLDWIARYQFFPMCADMGLGSIADIEVAYTLPSYLAIIRPDEQKFSKPADMLSFASERRVEI